MCPPWSWKCAATFGRRLLTIGCFDLVICPLLRLDRQDVRTTAVSAKSDFSSSFEVYATMRGTSKRWSSFAASVAASPAFLPFTPSFPFRSRKCALIKVEGLFVRQVFPKQNSSILASHESRKTRTFQIRPKLWLIYVRKKEL